MPVSKDFQKKMDQRLLYSLGYPKEPIIFLYLPKETHNLLVGRLKEDTEKVSYKQYALDIALVGLSVILLAVWILLDFFAA